MTNHLGPTGVSPRHSREGRVRVPTWKDFRIIDDLLEAAEGQLCEGEIIVKTLPGRLRVLEKFAKAEDRDRAELSGMLFDWAIQQLVAAGSWSELMKRSGQP